MQFLQVTNKTTASIHFVKCLIGNSYEGKTLIAVKTICDITNKPFVFQDMYGEISEHNGYIFPLEQITADTHTCLREEIPVELDDGCKGVIRWIDWNGVTAVGKEEKMTYQCKPDFSALPDGISIIDVEE